MKGSDLEISRSKGVVIAKFNRPDKLNALSKEMFVALGDLVDVLETDRAARVLIITAAGEKSFCVGADLKERQGMSPKDVLVRLEWVHELYLRMERLPVATIAAINGIALGGGLEIALACDLRVASENAIIGLPEVGLAIIPGNGGTQRLPRLIGPSKAMELILLAKRLTANEALHYGLVNNVVAPGQALDYAKGWAEKIKEAGPIAIRQAKSAIRMGLDRSVDEAMSLEIEAYKACLHSEDRLEGLKAFVEKRKPEYRGE